MKPRERDDRIDFLRFLGLAMIVLAHVDSPPLLFQLRNFDVPLMVLVSGVSYGLAFRQEDYLSYLWKRVKRLLFPVWIFLTAYFVADYALSFTGRVRLPGPTQMADSYLLLTGIGYVWIIRVFLMIAAVAPIIHRLDTKITSNAAFFCGLLAIYLPYEALRGLYLDFPFDLNYGHLFEHTVLQIIPYALIFAIGLRLRKMTQVEIILLCLIFLVIFCGAGIFYWYRLGYLGETQPYKYPPSAYYLSYALFVACLAWLISGRLVRWAKICRLHAPIMFVARNSIWIYLWHIAFVDHVWLPYYLKYCVVLGAASLTVLVQTRAVAHLIRTRIDDPGLRKNLVMVFTG